MNPLVTISVPIFKCEAFIERCLQSIRLQTYSNIEVILVNDQTPDKSVAVAAEFISKHQLSSWQIIDLDANSGLSVVRNEGIKNARGKYIFFLDSDDEILLDAIDTLVKLAEEQQADIAMGEVQGIRSPENEKVDVFPIHTKENILRGNKKILRELVNGGFAVSSWNKLISLSFLKSNNLYFTKGLYAQDALHTFEMALHLETIAFLRAVTYVYYLHQDSVIHNRKKIHFDNWITIAEIINRHLLEEKDAERRKLILEYLINFKAVTLQMNWKAQQDEHLWKRSYNAYRKLSGLRISDYLSSHYSAKLKRNDLFYRLPSDFGFKFFRWRYER